MNESILPPADSNKVRQALTKHGYDPKGRRYARVSKVSPGTYLEAGDIYHCLTEGQVYKVLQDLQIECDLGSHMLVPERDFLPGFYPVPPAFYQFRNPEGLSLGTLHSHAKEDLRALAYNFIETDREIELVEDGTVTVVYLHGKLCGTIERSEP